MVEDSWLFSDADYGGVVLSMGGIVEDRWW